MPLLSSRPKLVLSPMEVESTTAFKYVGMTFSEDSTWSAHIETVFQKACRLCYFTRRLRCFGLPQFIIGRVVLSTLLPIILYCSPAIFPGLVGKNWVLSRRLLLLVSRAAVIPYDELADTLVKRHFSECNLLSAPILENPNHPLHDVLLEAKCLRSTRQNVRSLAARTTRFRNFVISYMVRYLQDYQLSDRKRCEKISGQMNVYVLSILFF